PRPRRPSSTRIVTALSAIPTIARTTIETTRDVPPPPHPPPELSHPSPKPDSAEARISSPIPAAARQLTNTPPTPAANILPNDVISPMRSLSARQWAPPSQHQFSELSLSG